MKYVVPTPQNMFDLALKCLMKLVRGDAEAVNASGARASPSVKASR